MNDRAGAGGKEVARTTPGPLPALPLFLSLSSFSLYLSCTTPSARLDLFCPYNALLCRLNDLFSRLCDLEKRAAAATEHGDELALGRVKTALGQLHGRLQQLQDSGLGPSKIFVFPGLFLRI